MSTSTLTRVVWLVYFELRSLFFGLVLQYCFALFPVRGFPVVCCAFCEGNVLLFFNYFHFFVFDLIVVLFY